MEYECSSACSGVSRANAGSSGRLCLHTVDENKPRSAESSPYLDQIGRYHGGAAGAPRLAVHVDAVTALAVLQDELDALVQVFQRGDSSQIHGAEAQLLYSQRLPLLQQAARSPARTPVRALEEEHPEPTKTPTGRRGGAVTAARRREERRGVPPPAVPFPPPAPRSATRPSGAHLRGAAEEAGLVLLVQGEDGAHVLLGHQLRAQPPSGAAGLLRPAPPRPLTLRLRPRSGSAPSSTAWSMRWNQGRREAGSCARSAVYSSVG